MPVSLRKMADNAGALVKPDFRAISGIGRSV
jgi:hypothetical protein